MKKILLSCLILGSLFADTSKVRVDKMISETHCKAFYNSIMPINTRNLIYNADIINKVKEKGNNYYVITIIKYGKDRQFSCVNVKMNNQLHLLEMGIFDNKNTPIKTFQFDDMINGFY